MSEDRLSVLEAKLDRVYTAIVGEPDGRPGLRQTLAETQRIAVRVEDRVDEHDQRISALEREGWKTKGAMGVIGGLAATVAAAVVRKLFGGI